MLLAQTNRDMRTAEGFLLLLVYGPTGRRGEETPEPQLARRRCLPRTLPE